MPLSSVEITAGTQPSIHWIGAGLSSGPGIVALADQGETITVWDLTTQRGEFLRSHCAADASLDVGILNFDDPDSEQNFRASLNPGDIIVSMLPTSYHGQVAKLALAEMCHMVTSSYLTDEMRDLHEKAVAKGLSIVGEVGLDPGIDHLLAHILVDAARREGMLGQGYTLDFISYCGGIPVEKTPFTYKFSWTPLGVLAALKNPATSISDGRKQVAESVWDHVEPLTLRGESFEVYPNRNSLSYIAQYGLEAESDLRTFVRGTIRQNGWKEAWRDIFTDLRTATEAELRSLSTKLWQDHPYETEDKDRVVLHVALSVTAPGETTPKWRAALSLDQTGTGWRSAMASCVSLTMAQAVNALSDGRLAPGVQAAPHDITEARRWLAGLAQQGIQIQADNIAWEG